MDKTRETTGNNANGGGDGGGERGAAAGDTVKADGGAVQVTLPSKDGAAAGREAVKADGGAAGETSGSNGGGAAAGVSRTELLARLSEALTDEEFADEFLRVNPAVRARAVRGYLTELSARAFAPTVRTAGTIPLTPAPKPSDLKEAKKLADFLFGG